jgi:SAM-dependent methyltransferase
MKEVFENVKCTVCSADDTQLVTKKGQFNIPLNVVLCKACGLGYLNPRWDENTYFDFYSNTYDSYYRPALIKEINTVNPSENIIYKRLKKFNLLTKDFDSILDIGSGAGENLLNFQKLYPNAELEAIEPSHEAQAHLRRNKINVISSDANSDWELANDKKYSLIILRHVLEHFLEPRLVLKKIRKTLTDDGILYIAVPNNLNPKKNLEPFWFRVVHAYYFNKHSLYNLLALEKLEIVFLGEGDEMGPNELFVAVRKANTEIKPKISKKHFEEQMNVFSARLKIDNKLVNKLKRVASKFIAS